LLFGGLHIQPLAQVFVHVQGPLIETVLVKRVVGGGVNIGPDVL
jgi:hypothetical protein